MKLFGSKTRPAVRIDLETVRETLAYMHDDMRQAPELAAVASALAQAIDEIDAVSGVAPGQTNGGLHHSAAQNVVAMPAVRLVPWKPGS